MLNHHIMLVCLAIDISYSLSRGHVQTVVLKTLPSLGPYYQFLAAVPPTVLNAQSKFKDLIDFIKQSL